LDKAENAFFAGHPDADPTTIFARRHAAEDRPEQRLVDRPGLLERGVGLQAHFRVRRPIADARHGDPHLLMPQIDRPALLPPPDGRRRAIVPRVTPADFRFSTF
jgi:hypothetical protein